MGIGFQVTFDCADPDHLARFWGALLRYDLQSPPPGYATWDAFLDELGVPPEDRGSMNAIVDPDGRGPRLLFQRVPEPKRTKNRVHLDVNVGGGPGTPLEERRRRVDDAVGRALELGARRVEAHEQHGEYWVVMEDPEGNEFCLQ